MKKLIKKTIDLEFEIGKTYKTKFQTGDLFLVKEIIKDKNNKVIKFIGIYENAKHLGNCPLNGERLITETIEIDDYIDVCESCGKTL